MGAGLNGQTKNDNNSSKTNNNDKRDKMSNYELAITILTISVTVSPTLMMRTHQ